MSKEGTEISFYIPVLSWHKIREWKYFKLFIIYTASFFALFYLIYGIQYQNAGKSFLWKYDGIEQGYASFIYAHKYIRSVLHNIFINHKLVVPKWDYTIGYGSDIFQTLTVYGMYDLFRNIIAALSPEKSLEKAFHIMIVAKYYIMGISFIAYAKSRKKNDVAAICGGIVYLFSLPASIGLIQASFINVFIFLPLIFVGIDQLEHRKISFIYIVMMAAVLLDNFYFFYMIAIIIFIYYVQRILFSSFCGGIDTKGVFLTCLKLMVNTLIPMGIAAPAYIPVIINLISTSRLSEKNVVPLFYDKAYYYGIIKGFVSGYDSGNDWLFGFGPIMLVLVILFYLLDMKRHVFLKLCFAELSLGLLIPFVGHVMNGFNYPSNRWIFAYAFCLAYMTTIFFENFDKLNISKVLLVLIMQICYLFLLFILKKQVNATETLDKTIIWVFASILLMAFLGVVRVKNIAMPVRTDYVLFAVITASLVISSSSWWNYKNNYSIKNSVDIGVANDVIEMSNAQSLLKNEDTSVAKRYDSLGIYYKRNASWAKGNGISCMDMYLSLYNNNIDMLNKNLAILTDPFYFSYHGLNARSELEALFGVDYYIVNKDNISQVPVGYSDLYIDNDYNVYRPDFDVSSCYVFDKTLDYEDYYSLCPEEKQQALMQAVVVDGDDDTVAVGELNLTDDVVNFTYAQDSLEFIEDNTIEISNTNQKVIVNVDNESMPEGEWYVFFDELEKTEASTATYLTTIKAYEGDQLSKEIAFSSTTSKSNMYARKHDWLINMGKHQGISSLEISFNKVGKYSFKKMLIYCRPISTIENNLRGLTSAGLLKISSDKMTIDVATNEKKWLFISQPYSTGWEAWVDGEKVEIMKADDAFMAIYLDKGDHNIVFKYHSPGLLLSLFLSIISMMVLIILWVNFPRLCLDKQGY